MIPSGPEGESCVAVLSGSWGAAGINKELRARGIQEHDTVVIGDTQLEWSDDQSEGALYAAWREEKIAKGTAWQGSARWPHAA